MRENQEGALYALNSQRLSARHVNAIEKKPLFHFYPGSTSYSIGTHGCNFSLRLLHELVVSQTTAAGPSSLGEEITPAQSIAEAESERCRSIAYTDIEPTIFFEYILDTTRLSPCRIISNV